jgi:hypothetical protein
LKKVLKIRSKRITDILGMRNVYKFLVGMLERKRPLGRPGHTLHYDIKFYLK